MGNFRRNSILNLVFNYSNIIFNLVTGIFLVPLYLRKIPLDAYGSFLVATGIAGLIGLMEFGLSMVTTQRLAKYRAQAEWTMFRQTTYSGVVAASLLFVLTCTITFATAVQVPWLTKINPTFEADLQLAFVLFGIAGAASIYMNLFSSIFQALLKAGTPGAINLFSAAFGIVTVVMAFSLHPSLAAIAAGTFARAVCATLLMLANAIFTLHKVSLLPQTAPLKSTFWLLWSCGPVFLGTVSKSIAENAQNLLLANAITPSAIAVLALTQKALQVCHMVLAPIGSSIYSNLAQMKAKSEPAYFASLLGASIRGHFLLSVLLIATAACFNQSFVTLWVGEEKFGGIALTVLLSVSVLITSRFLFFNFLIYSTGEFRKPLVLELSFSFAKVIIIFCTVKHMGLFAIPIAEISAGFTFLFLLSTRLMVSNLKGSDFIAGIYYRGWPEFAAVLALGTLALQKWPVNANWQALILMSLVFMICACVFIMASNFDFIKKLVFYFKR